MEYFMINFCGGRIIQTTDDPHDLLIKHGWKTTDQPQFTTRRYFRDQCHCETELDNSFRVEVSKQTFDATNAAHLERFIESHAAKVESYREENSFECPVCHTLEEFAEWPDDDRTCPYCRRAQMIAI